MPNIWVKPIAVAGEINRAGECEGCTHTLQQAADLGGLVGTETEQDTANRSNDNASGDDVFGAEPVQ
jgi:hypothetical protein